MGFESRTIVFVMPALVGGGAERVAIALSTYFIKNNYRFIFLLTKACTVEYEIPEGVTIISECDNHVMTPQKQILLIRKYMKKYKSATFISFLPHQNIYTLIASIGLSANVVVSVRNDPRYDFPGSIVLPIIRNVLYRRARRIVFQTRQQAALLPKRLQKKGCVIPNPIPDDMPTPFEGCRRKVIVTSGRLEEQKNHEMTLRAFAIFHKDHPDFSLEIFGKGSKEEDLRALARNLNISNVVHFAGFSPKAINHVRSASVFVMSSKFEGLSNAMLEALCMGVPTICTRSMGGGAEAVIDNDFNGILIDIDDDVAEAEALSFMIDHPWEARNMGSHAMALRSLFSIDSIGRQWVEAIEMK